MPGVGHPTERFNPSGRVVLRSQQGFERLASQGRLFRGQRRVDQHLRGRLSNVLAKSALVARSMFIAAAQDLLGTGRGSPVMAHGGGIDQGPGRRPAQLDARFPEEILLAMAGPDLQGILEPAIRHVGSPQQAARLAGDQGHVLAAQPIRRHVLELAAVDQSHVSLAVLECLAETARAMTNQGQQPLGLGPVIEPFGRGRRRRQLVGSREIPRLKVRPGVAQHGAGRLGRLRQYGRARHDPQA